MSGQQHYRQDTQTGELFCWSPSGGAFVGCITRRVVYPNTPEYTRLVTPRNASALPNVTSSSSTPYQVPSFPGGYTYEKRETLLPPNRPPANAPLGDVAPATPQQFRPLRQATAANISGGYGLPAASQVTSRMANTSLAADPSNRGSASTSVTSPEQPAQRIIRGGQAGYEQIDSRYRPRQHSFFKRGRVFMVYWSEPASNETVVTEVTEVLPKEIVRDSKHGLKIHSKVRRFIVVREGNNYCKCVRITTYDGRGVAKPGVDEREHAVAYCGKYAPDLLPDEARARCDTLMRTPIRIQTDETGDKLDFRSRIDYGRVYTVEHNVWARAFGYVHQSSEKAFFYDFKNVDYPDEIPERQVSGGNTNEPTERRQRSAPSQANSNAPSQAAAYSSPPPLVPNSAGQPSGFAPSYPQQSRGQTRTSGEAGRQPQRRRASSSNDPRTRPDLQRRRRDSEDYDEE